MKYWFTADLHFNHKHILEFTDRPYKIVDRMDEALIKKWNSRVKDEDLVFHVGDFCFKNKNVDIQRDYIDKLNGKIIFILGNHDKRSNGLKTCIRDIHIRIGGKDLLLIHNSVHSCYGFDLVLCGHSHQYFKFKTLDFEGYRWDACNVGVDVWRGYPVSIEEIIKQYDKWKVTGKYKIPVWK